MSLLENINSPSDLKKLPESKLPDLASEIREYMVDVISKNGGHLAPSLGVVELSIALHYIFDTPNDKIIWDVGHQSYAHKILTGRREAFKNIRQVDGIAGFTKRSEGPYDPFGSGHASISISAALGIAKSFKKRGMDNRAIAVIGDGAMTGGPAFEGLNQAGFRTGNLIVVLNDNEMSISKNVGALSKFFSLHMYSRRGTKLRRWIKRAIARCMPKKSRLVYMLARRIEEVTTGFLTPGFMFESFGFHYVGPLDGHNLRELVHVFREINSTTIGETPILIHVLTKKGTGYKPAEDNPTKFHGIGPFDKLTGKTTSGGGIVSFTQGAGAAVLELAKKDKDIIGITAAMSTGTGFDALAKELPDQFYDVGIAEGHAVTFAAGLATEGHHPVIAVYSTFLQRAFDQIIHDVCLQNLPVTILIDRAGLVGEDGPTHHGAFDISYLRQIPNMTVMAPRDENVLRHMIYTAIYSGRPCAVRYPRGNGFGIAADKDFKKMPIGTSELLYGSLDVDVAILAVGHVVWPAVEAARALNKKGIGVCVIDARFIKPLDTEMLLKISQTAKTWVTVEEGSLAGGFGASIAEWLAQNNIRDIRLKMIGLPDKFIEQGPQDVLRARYGLDANGIIKAVEQLMSGGLSEDGRIPERRDFAKETNPTAK